jgi:hypothetical protein
MSRGTTGEFTELVVIVERYPVILDDTKSGYSKNCVIILHKNACWAPP